MTVYRVAHVQGDLYVSSATLRLRVPDLASLYKQWSWGGDGHGELTPKSSLGTVRYGRREARGSQRDAGRRVTSGRLHRRPVVPATIKESYERGWVNCA